MSERFPGGVISKTAPVPTGPYENGTAPGIWTLEQQAEFVRQGIWPIAGNVPNYIEDVFSTWLYTGNGSTQTINNGIDLAGKGGLVWSKNRTQVDNNRLYDTVRGTNNVLFSNSTSAALTDSNTVTAFNSNGYSIGTSGNVSFNGDNFASWTFRKQPKFFDVVTYTGNALTGNEVRAIPHGLGSAPGCVIVKRTDSAWSWFVQHQALGPTKTLFLNATNATRTNPGDWGDTSPTATDFYVSGNINENGGQYVAYVFAHNAGGFGLTGTDNVISCGSYTGNGSTNGPVIDLGYEPQWVMIKRTNSTGNWFMEDTMRGMNLTGSAYLSANLSAEEQVFPTSPTIAPNATGFQVVTSGTGYNASGGTYIYIAIRRGPMRTPTTGTSVFAPTTTTSTAAFSVGFPTDLGMFYTRDSVRSWNTMFSDRLRGNVNLVSSVTDAEAAGSNMDFTLQNSFRQLITSTSSVCYTFRRAPGFFDEVCYTGTGSATTVAHNLGVAPELMMVKRRNDIANWTIYTTTTGVNQATNFTSDATFATTAVLWNSTAPTASVFSVGTNSRVNVSGSTYVNYLFASCPGVSKVGTYTGTGTTQVINCGFTGGARFVLIKATSTTGAWYVWDSARGIVAGNDPYLELNTTNAEVTNTDWVDTAASGFELSNAGGNLANSNGVSYIFLAIA